MLVRCVKRHAMLLRVASSGRLIALSAALSATVTSYSAIVLTVCTALPCTQMLAVVTVDPEGHLLVLGRIICASETAESYVAVLQAVAGAEGSPAYSCSIIKTW
jgi:hypothetical protein